MPIIPRRCKSSLLQDSCRPSTFAGSSRSWPAHTPELPIHTRRGYGTVSTTEERHESGGLDRKPLSQLNLYPGTVHYVPKISTRTYRTPASSLRRSSSSAFRQPTATSSSIVSDNDVLSSIGTQNIRDKLRRWQEEDEKNEATLDLYDLKLGSSILGRSFGRFRDPDYFSDNASVSAGAPGDVAGSVTDDTEENAPPYLVGYPRMGDLVEISRATGGVSGSEPVVAVFIRQFATQIQCYTMNGKWIHRGVKTVEFSIPSYFKLEELEELLPHLPQSEVTKDMMDQAYMLDLSIPRSVGADIVTKLKEFWDESQSVYRRHSSVLDKIYDALSQEENMRFGTLEAITKAALKGENITPAALYAVRKALCHAGIGVVLDNRSIRMANIYQLIPSKSVMVLSRVQGWLRAFQEHLVTCEACTSRQDCEFLLQSRTYSAHVAKFLMKARKLIDSSRKIREVSPGSTLGPLKAGVSEKDIHAASEIMRLVQISQQDRDIIDFCLSYAVLRRFRRNNDMKTVMAVLLRSTGRYDEVSLGEVTTYLFLQEIGFILPDEDRFIHDDSLLLPESGQSQPLVRMAYAVRQLEEVEGFDLTDRLAQLRSEWCGPTIYCVDPIGTDVVDDGFSIEDVPDKPTEKWLHVHVADPSSFLPKNHIVSKLAAHKTQTLYLPQQHYPMMPPKLAESRFSLADGRPMLTFSGRIDAFGNVVETKIQPGTARNITHINTASFNQTLFGVAKGRIKKQIAVGDVPTQLRPQHVSLTKLQEEELQKLKNVALSRQRLRYAAGAVRSYQPIPDIKVSGDALEALRSLPEILHAPRLAASDPGILMTSVGFQPPSQVVDGSLDIVMECMLAAGEVAARWCHSRDLTTVYRGTIPNPYGLDSESYQQLLRPIRDPNSRPRFREISLYGRRAAATLYTPEPLEHAFLGLSMFSRVTSPLRRYVDLMIHWQIGHALLQESGLPHFSLKGVDQNEKGVFGRQEMQGALRRLTAREQLMRSAEMSSVSSWVARLFLRAKYYGHGTLPETFQILINRFFPEREEAIGSVLDYGFYVYMLSSEAQLPANYGIPEEGDIWEVAIHDVDCFAFRVIVKPIRRIARDA